MKEQPDIHDLLRMCRNRSGLSQEQLAGRLFVDQAIISKVEKGKIVPSYVLVKQWAKETNSQDVIGMDFSGLDGWNKFRMMEAAIIDVRKRLELVSFFRIKKR